MEKVIQLYGRDALVVSNKKAKNQTEIIVAIDLADHTQKTLDSMHVPPQDKPRVTLGEMPNFDQVMESEIFKTPSTLAYDPLQELSIDIDPAAIAEFNQETQAQFIDETKGRTSELDNPVSQEREHLKAREIVDLVKQELAVMRREFKLSQQLDAWSGTQAVTDEMRPLIEAFNETGMPVGLRALVTEVVNKNTDMTSALEDIATVLGEGIKHINLLEDMRGIHLIAGSSGAGKTLMAGRLAKQAGLAHGDQAVAIISFNDSRYGAWNQTQLIGAQAGVETFRANSPEMLEVLLQELASRRLVIIDTPGGDLDNQLKLLTTLLPEAQKHLVLASDASEASVKRHLKSETITWDSVMLSRLEVGIHPWAIINALLNENTPISVASAEPSIIDSAATLTGLALAKHALAHLPISFV
jgi:flagellar biosynthesis GTPase FlhF